MLFGACQEELFEQYGPEVSEGEQVELTFRADLPGFADVTKSFSEPAISNLYLIVFDNNGYLVEKREATPVNSWTVSTTAPTEFSVTLTASVSKRIIHFIANYNGPDQLQFGSESDVIGSMTHINGADAYWQRMEFLGGINTNTLKDKTVPLLRNHARIRVTDNADNFTISRYTIVNVVNEGYVSPYNKNTGTFAEFIAVNADGSFVQTGDSYVNRSYADITNGSDGYEGYIPEVTEFNLNNNIPDLRVWKAAADEYYYMYERRFEKDSYTYMLIEGTYTGDGAQGNTTPTYYKVDLVYNDNNGVTQNYNILRNFDYNVTIKSVSANGKATPAAAAGMVGSHNNLVASVEVQHLPSISNGSAQLYVSYTKEYIVSSDPIDLYFKYIPNIKVNGKPTSNSNATVQLGTGDVVRATVIADADETSGTYAGWRKVTIYPNAPEDGILQQDITVVAGDLSRNVSYALVRPYEMSAVCRDGANGANAQSDVIPTQINAPVTVKVTIPSNLPETLFPLEFYVEARERTLHPNATKNQLPVEIIPESLFAGVGDTFGFKKEMSWTEYTANSNFTINPDGTRTFDLHFKTNTDISASSVYVYNKYFNVAIARFNNHLNNVQLSGSEFYGTSTPVVLTFDAVANQEYFVTSEQVEFGDPAIANGTVTVTGTPKSWYGEIEIKVENGGTETITGLNRNVMKLGAMIAGTDAPAATELVRVYATDGTILGSGLWSEYLAGTMTIKRDNLTDPDVIIGRIAYTIAGVTRASQQMTPTTLMQGATLNFTVMSN